jgi:hypothetical protein
VSIFLPGFHDDRAYLLVLFAPLLFGVAAIVVLTRLRVRGRPTTAVHSAHVEAAHEQGLVIPYSRALGAVYLLVCCTTLTSFVVIAAITLVAVAVTRAGELGLVIQAVICVGFSAYLLWTLTEIVRKRLTRGVVMLTPHGVYHRSWAFDSFLSWEQAVSVSAGQLDGQLITLAAYDNARPPVRRRSRIWKQPEYKLAPHTAIRGMYLSVDPGLAFHTLNFYHANPRARAELGTEAAAQRVRSGNVLTV